MSRPYKRWAAAVAVAAAIAIPSVSFATNGMNDIGVGAKAKGMGGVGIALPQDSFAAAHNPAGAVFVGCRYDLGVGYTFQNAEAAARTNSQLFSPFTAKSDQGLWYPELAFNWNYIPCQSMGVTGYIYGAIDTSYSYPGADDGAYEFYSILLSPYWSWRFSCSQSVGFAFNVAWNGLRASGINNLPTVFPPISNMSLYPDYVSDNGTDWELGVGFRVGWYGRITRCFRVGATFQSKTWMAKFKKYQGLCVDDGSYDLPAEVGIGLAWDICPCLTLGFDFIDRFWRCSKTFDHTSRQSGGQTWGGGTNIVFGTENGIGFGWKDQPIAKLGLAYRCRCWTFRIGYNHGNGPIGWSTETLLNTLTQCVVEDHVTIGATWNTGCGELSAYYYHGFRYRIRGNGSGGTANDDQPVNYNLANEQNAVGISYGSCF